MRALRTAHEWLTLSRFETPMREWAGSALLLFLRFYIGWQFFASGRLKIANWDGTLALFREEYTVPVLPPVIAAYAGAFGELFFPCLLFVGFCSRAAALGLFAVNAMAVISYPILWKLECAAAINDHKSWAIGIATIVCFGPGRASLDWWLRRREPAPAAA